jgi:CheY-like chemotaxis protein
MKNAIKKVLVIDDDAGDAELTLSALRESCAEAEISTLNSGVEAFNFLDGCARSTHPEDALPDLILLDMSLPILSGLQVLRKIKQDRHLRAIPVVVLTDSRQATDVDDSYRLGANAYVLKPFAFSDYIQAVKDICRFWLGLNETSFH